MDDRYQDILGVWISDRDYGTLDFWSKIPYRLIIEIFA